MEPNKTINLKTKIIYNNMNEEIKNKIIELKKEGKSFRSIAKDLNISLGSVQFILKNTNTLINTLINTTEEKKEIIKEDNKKEYRTKEGYTIGEDIFIF